VPETITVRGSGMGETVAYTQGKTCRKQKCVFPKERGPKRERHLFEEPGSRTIKRRRGEDL